MQVGIFLTNQNPPGRDMVSALEEQYVITRFARDRGWDAVGTGQHYLSEGMRQLQHPEVVTVPADDLKADRQAFRGEAGRHRRGRAAGRRDPVG